MSTSNATAATNELVIIRTLNAPRELVFKVWTQAEHLAQWWGPKGFKVGIHALNLTPGGAFHYSMESPDGQQMWGKLVYHEVVSPERLTYVSSFSNEAGETIRHPLSATWPLETLNKMTFTEHDGKTTLTLRGGPINATAEELATFEQARPMVEKGFDGMFSQLESYMASL